MMVEKNITMKIELKRKEGDPSRNGRPCNTMQKVIKMRDSKDEAKRCKGGTIGEKNVSP